MDDSIQAESAAIAGQLTDMQMTHDVRILAPSLLRRAIDLYRMMHAAGVIGDSVINQLPGVFTERLLAPGEPVPDIIRAPASGRPN